MNSDQLKEITALADDNVNLINTQAAQLKRNVESLRKALQLLKDGDHYTEWFILDSKLQAALRENLIVSWDCLQSIAQEGARSISKEGIGTQDTKEQEEKSPDVERKRRWLPKA